ncbi:MAG TPA: phosphate ABC transporter substrate-binding protein [Ktedonobacteraceae bacterium]
MKTRNLFCRLSLLKYKFRSARLLALASGLLFLLVACVTPFNNTPAALSGQIKVDGSTALQPLVSKAATSFEKLYPQVHINVSGGGSVTGLSDVASHRVDIGDSDIYADPATYPDPNLTDHLVCVIPFTMIVSSDINLTNLTTSDIINIFATGKYTNWAQLGGPDLPIVPIVRPPTSGTRATFRRYILGGRDELSTLTAISSSQDLVTRVAQTPGAIGYLAASVLNAQVRVISINSYAASLKNIESGHYTFWSYEHMYTLNTLNQTNGALIDAFLNFMLAPQFQPQVVALHYFPISDLKFPLLSANTPVGTSLGTPYLVEERKRFRV